MPAQAANAIPATKMCGLTKCRWRCRRRHNRAV